MKSEPRETEKNEASSEGSAIWYVRRVAIRSKFVDVTLTLSDLSKWSERGCS